MASTTRTNSTRDPGVTRSEFDAFSHHIDQRFNAIGTVLQELSKKLDNRSQPQYGLLVSIGSLMATLIAGGALVISGQIKSMDSLSMARDHALQQTIHHMQTGSNRWTLSDHRSYAEHYEESVDERFDEQTDRIAKLETSYHASARAMGRIDAQLSTWVTELQSRGDWMHNKTVEIARLNEAVQTLRKDSHEKRTVTN